MINSKRKLKIYVVLILLLMLVGCNQTNTVQPDKPGIPGVPSVPSIPPIPGIEEIPDIPGFGTSTNSDEEVQSITILSPYITLYKNSLFNVTTFINPINAGLQGYSFTWQSSDPSVATVIGLGKDASITALKKGKTTITITSSNGISAALQVTVIE